MAAPRCCNQFWNFIPLRDILQVGRTKVIMPTASMRLVRARAPLSVYFFGMIVASFQRECASMVYIDRGCFRTGAEETSLSYCLNRMGSEYSPDLYENLRQMASGVGGRRKS